MKFFIYLIFSISLLYGTSVEHKIKKSKKQLSSKKVQYKKMDKKLSEIAKKVLTAKKEQKKLSSRLARLSSNIKSNELEFKNLQKLDKKYITSLANFNVKIAAKKEKFLDLVATNFSLALALEELNQPTADSIMMKEVYKVYEQKNKKSLEDLGKEIESLKAKKNSLKAKQQTIKKRIARYASERNEFKIKKQKQDKIVKKLALDKAIYKKRFNKIRSARKSLERKLAKLKIIKRSNDKAAKERRERKRREERQRIAAAAVSANNNRKVPVKTPIKAPKAVVPTSTVKYTGGKTISPLKGSRLIKRFGTYIDPIYKFKIFNKSITLKAPHKGSKVRSVLAGKVVFAENSGGMLGKVVIVEHANKMHTIYAKLSRLAPGIHVGKRLSRGSIIGKVDKSLMFEVTKNNKHINPTKLIKL